jgi:hypothetical protein
MTPSTFMSSTRAMSAGSFTVQTTTFTPSARAAPSESASTSRKSGDQMFPFASCTARGTAAPFLPEVR